MDRVLVQLATLFVSNVEDIQAYDKVGRVLVQLATLFVSNADDIQAYDKVG